MARFASLFAALLLALLLSVASTQASDWARFRGPNGSGVSPDPAPPAEWSDEKNLAWRVELPGPGSSCPIVVGDKVLVTCWIGYGLDRDEPGDQANLKRELVCLSRATGDKLWSATEPAKLPEDEYSGMFTQHGYASHTPTSDGERVYVYYGKSGALAYDMDGKELWRRDCGDGSGRNDWGSAASPILYNNLLICSATAESNALIALDKTTGAVVWRYAEEGWDGVWSTPILVETHGRTELVLSVPGKVLALAPETGEVLWNCPAGEGDSVSSSAITADGVIYTITGRDGAMAVRAGGSGEVEESQVEWRENLRGGIGTALVHDGLIYWSSRGMMNCVDAATGEEVYQERLVVDEAPQADAPAEAAEGEAGESGDAPRRRGRRGGRGGSRGYASPVVAGDYLYNTGRDGTFHVVRLGREYDLAAVNKLADGGDFSATPALSDGMMLVRSSKYLYCIKAEGDAVAKNFPLNAVDGPTASQR
ncbi:outer membrane biogenesis protein BamB [Pseudobythopirellula maris]|uniref:Outer membrane biogenesis protein BamB n=1 Tax=Pseudobythopirellula maris TaxID=2527991 RepID=A0A5C5ZU90_9BACT|nr:PQQ-binding-like beta-propeller repeat protein [Pseudobythopirellula maris]TWT91092.1 outer membrane biogenesis protein BamB [Pseudobythopirellula maris]